MSPPGAPEVKQTGYLFYALSSLDPITVGANVDCTASMTSFRITWLLRFTWPELTEDKDIIPLDVAEKGKDSHACCGKLPWTIV